MRQLWKFDQIKSPTFMPRLPLPEHTAVDSTGHRISVVRQTRMREGIYAKASAYANNANRANASAKQYRGILIPKRDPIMRGDASNRYAHSGRNELDGNYSPAHVDEVEYIPSRNLVFPPGQDLNARKMGNTDMRTSTRPAATKSKSINFSDPLEIEEDLEDRSHDKHLFDAPQAALGIGQSESNRYQSDLSFNTTQQLRSGFFRSIKRQYSPILTPKQGPIVSSQCSTDSGINTSCSASSQPDEDYPDINGDDGELEEYAMTKLARHKLNQLRLKGVKNVSVPTGLQWIRLELHEMREQDKSLFLQLIKLHSAIKDLRADMTGDEDFDSYDDLHSAQSLWWPRRGHSFSTLPDFSSSDGAQLFRGGKSKTPLRRGFSLNYPTISSPSKGSPELPLREDTIPYSINDS